MSYSVIFFMWPINQSSWLSVSSRLSVLSVRFGMTMKCCHLSLLILRGRAYIYRMLLLASSVSVLNDLYSVCYKDFISILICKQQHQAATSHEQFTLKLRCTKH